MATVKDFIKRLTQIWIRILARTIWSKEWYLPRVFMPVRLLVGSQINISIFFWTGILGLFINQMNIARNVH